MLIRPRSDVDPIEPIRLNCHNNSCVSYVFISLPTKFLNDDVFSGRDNRFDNKLRKL